MAFVFFANSESNAIDDHVADKVKTFLESQDKPEDIIILGDQGLEHSLRITEFFVRLYREHKLHANDQVAILSGMDELVCIQLVLAANNKQVGGDFSVDGERVSSLHSHVVSSKLPSSLMQAKREVLERKITEQEVLVTESYKSFLTDSNAVDLADVYLAVRSGLEANLKLRNKIEEANFLIIKSRFYSPVEEAMVSLLSLNKRIMSVSLCVPLDESFGPTLSLSRVEVNIEDCRLEEITARCCTGNDCFDTTSATQSATELFLEQVFLGYLRLLLNSRDELSLARVINVPNRGLDHRAFTDVKHESKDRGLSMYQTVMSFVMRMRIGTKSYGSGSQSPLMKHSKGLGEFIDLMLKLQTIVEEDVNVESALRRIVTVVKNCILKSSEPQLRRTSVEAVACRFCDEAASLSQRICMEQNESKVLNTCVTSLCCPTLRVIRSMLDRRAVIPLPDDGTGVLSDSASSQKTPIRFASLLSVFRSPEEEVEVEKVLVEKGKKRPFAKVQPVLSYQSSLDWAPNCTWTRDSLPLTDFVPSKTLVCPAAPTSARRNLDQSNGKENSQNTPETASNLSQTTLDKDQVMKMAAVSSSLMGAAPQVCSKRKAVAKKSTTTAKPKIMKLEKGQRQLSAFFRV